MKKFENYKKIKKGTHKTKKLEEIDINRKIGTIQD